MRIALKFDVNRVDPDKLSDLICELKRMGVYHNGQIVCDSDMDDQVQKVIDSYYPVE